VVINATAARLGGRGVIDSVRSRRPGCRIVVTEVADDAALFRDLDDFRIERFLPGPLNVGDLLRASIAALSLEGQWHMPSARFGPQVSRALAYIARHFTEQVTVRHIGRDIGVSPSHLAHLFHDLVGISVKDYVTRVRVDATKRALVTTDASLDVLAAQCGFCDASHLSRTFRRYTGQWPGQYRREADRAHQGSRIIHKVRTRVH
jgi:AraC-like DNA-binding protein